MKLPLFESMPREILNVIAQGSYLKRLKKKEMLYYQGDVAEKCYVILNGSIKVYLETTGSSESVINIVGTREIIGDIAIHEGARFLTSAQVVEDAYILAIPANILRQHVVANSQLASNLLKSISSSMHQLVRQIEHQTVMTAPQRLGCFLLRYLRCQEGSSEKALHLPYEKRVIAAQLQMTPETFSRAVETLKKYGVHVDHAIFTIDDPSTLSEFACKNCSRIPIPGEKFACCGYMALPSNEGGLLPPSNSKK